MRLVDFPVVCTSAVVVLFCADEASVGNYHQRFLNCRDDLRGKKIIGIVVAGEPVVAIHRLALGPDLARAGRISLRRLDKAETSAAVDALSLGSSIGVICDINCYDVT